MSRLNVGDVVELTEMYKIIYCKEKYNYIPEKHYLVICTASPYSSYVNLNFVDRKTHVVINTTRGGGFLPSSLKLVPPILPVTPEELICIKIKYLWERQEYFKIYVDKSPKI